MVLFSLVCAPTPPTTRQQKIDDHDEKCRRLVELNVQESCINLFANPIVQKKQGEDLLMNGHALEKSFLWVSREYVGGPVSRSCMIEVLSTRSQSSLVRHLVIFGALTSPYTLDA